MRPNVLTLLCYLIVIDKGRLQTHGMNVSRSRFALSSSSTDRQNCHQAFSQCTTLLAAEREVLLNETSAFLQRMRRGVWWRNLESKIRVAVFSDVTDVNSSKTVEGSGVLTREETESGESETPSSSHRPIADRSQLTACYKSVDSLQTSLEVTFGDRQESIEDTGPSGNQSYDSSLNDSTDEWLQLQLEDVAHQLSAALSKIKSARQLCCGDAEERMLPRIRACHSGTFNQVVEEVCRLKWNSQTLVKAITVSTSLPILSSLVQSWNELDCGRGIKLGHPCKLRTSEEKFRMATKMRKAMYTRQICHHIFRQECANYSIPSIGTSCSSSMHCSNARMAVKNAYFSGENIFILSNETALARKKLLATVALLCREAANASSNTIKTTTLDETCQSLCSLRLSCPMPHYVLSNKPDSLGLAFSPEIVRRNFLSTVVNRTGILELDKVISTSSLAWCRIGCSVHAVKLGEVEEKFFRYSISVLNVIFIVALLFACLVMWENRVRLFSTQDPRRAFIYLNVAAIYSRLRLIGLVMPSEFVICHADGSLVLDENAPLLCTFTAIITIVCSIAMPMALGWLCWIWHLTVGRLVRMQLARNEEEPHERVFLLAFLFVPWAYAFGVWYQYYHVKAPLEGHVLLKSCSFSTLIHAQMLEVGPLVALAIVSLMLFHKTSSMLKVTKNETPYSSTDRTLQRWHRRHRTIMMMGLALLVLLISRVISLFRTLSGGMYGYYKEEFQSFEQCWVSTDCRVQATCRYPASTRNTHFEHALFVGVYETIFCILTFGWIFFDEIRWPIFGRLKIWVENKWVYSFSIWKPVGR